MSPYADEFPFLFFSPNSPQQCSHLRELHIHTGALYLSRRTRGCTASSSSLMDPQHAGMACMPSLTSLTLRADVCRQDDLQRAQLLGTLQVLKAAAVVPLSLKRLDISDCKITPKSMQQALEPLPSTLEDLSLTVDTASGADSLAIAATLQNAGPLTKLMICCDSEAMNEQATISISAALCGLPTLQDLCWRMSCRRVQRRLTLRETEVEALRTEAARQEYLPIPSHLTRLVCEGQSANAAAGCIARRLKGSATSLQAA